MRASHDGYAGLGLRLERQLRLVGSTLLVEDFVEGSGPVALTWTWPLHPRLGARIERLGIVVHDGIRDRMTLDVPSGFTIELVRGGTRPGPGWHADGYGCWVPATTLCVSGSAMTPGRFTTRIGLLGGDS